MRQIRPIWGHVPFLFFFGGGSEYREAFLLVVAFSARIPWMGENEGKSFHDSTWAFRLFIRDCHNKTTSTSCFSCWQIHYEKYISRVVDVLTFSLFVIPEGEFFHECAQHFAEMPPFINVGQESPVMTARGETWEFLSPFLVWWHFAHSSRQCLISSLSTSA